MKKTVHIITSLEQGGAQSVLNDIIKDIPEQRHYVFFFKKGDFEQRLAHHCTLVHIPYSVHHPFAWWFLYKNIKKINPHILHTVLWSANFIGSLINRVLKRTHIASFHNRLMLNGTIRTKLDQFFHTKADICIAVSDEIKKDIIKTYHWQKAESIVVIPNGVTLPALIKPSKKSDSFVVGAVGRFEPVKQFSLLLDAIKIMSNTQTNIHLLLIGYGTQEKELRSLVCSLEILNKVTFLIKEPAYMWYPEMDCFVQPSQTEGISLALLEAMSHKVACIVTSADNNHPVINHEVDGLVCKPEKSEIAHGIERIKMNRILKNKLAHAGHDKIKKVFSHDVMIAQYKNCFMTKLSTL